MIELINLFNDKTLVRDFEKVSFDLGENRFNVSEGTWEIAQQTRNYFLEDELRYSPLHPLKTVEQLKQLFWEEIKVHLPKYKADVKDNGKTYYFEYLIQLAELVKDGQDIQLIYISDLAHAEMIRNCVTWLSQQI
ncbi:hypothetical protein PN499_22190 [Kamptonema animale CS-326]|jgi:hypothetical protein|uniref:hypothetical protein n=1 Tax=Kamptonema animale TaxID=92934 RepID=UPI00232AB605|nr:hypothetical protein [Kamptonema animale]MDB9513914.1 hypothetical protein [Kamptonema animale CS-326]